MFKKLRKSRRLKKALISALCCVTVTCTGLASACSTTTTTTTSYTDREDTQLLSNGDFEFFDYPDDAVYLIKTPDSWSSGGDSSSVMSGVISTSETNWEKQIDSTLAATLDYNNDLDEDDDDYEDEYVDYNGMTSKDILYKDSYAANLTVDDADDLTSAYIAKNDMTYEEYFGITYKDSNGTYWQGTTQVYLDDITGDYFYDEACSKSVRQELIENPATHYNVSKDYSYFEDEDGVKRDLFLDEDANDYYYIADDAEADDDGNYTEDDRRYISNVLMLHNADTSKNNGLATYYSSSSLTLEANTAAEITVWVKTSDLKFDKGYDQNSDQDRGAYIEVIQTVNSTSIDSFRITAINTEKLIANDSSLNTNNGWLKYTIYVNGCNFGDSTIQIRLGLGNPDNNSEKVSGYAFFDDVTVTQYKDLDSIESYADYEDSNGSIGAKTADDKINVTTTCAITGEGDEKIFYADYSIKANDYRNSRDFHYLVDLSLAYDDNGNVIDYTPFTFASSNVSAGLTYEEADIYSGETKYYAASTSDNATYTGVTQKTGTAYTLPSGLNGAEITTSKDLVGIFSVGESYTTYSSSYAATLKKNLTDNGITELPGYSSDSNILLLFSAYGAAYTATISDSSTFTLDKDSYIIVSFWVKTFDMDGNTAATAKIYDIDNKDGSYASYTIDSTSYTVDIGDDEDIYNGWTQCFFFVENASDSTKEFAIDFSFGISGIQSSTSTSYKYGWAAMANVQTLEINETINELSGSEDHMATFTMSDDDTDETHNVFDDETAISDIKSEISTPTNYTGVNGASSYVPNDGYDQNYDKTNTNSYAGLINQEYIENYSDSDLTAIFGAFDVDYASFTSAAEAWSAVFGNSYQPLIIVNNLRKYATVAELDESTYKTGYVLVTDGSTGEGYITCNGKTYRPVADDELYDEDTKYYSLNDIKTVANYGYIGASQTISSDSYVTISVKVMVSGNATAYIYLVNDDDKEVLSYNIPTYSFWYDDEGNVLDEEYDEEWSDSTLRSHIVYTLRDDGLYDGKDGELYGNLLNLVKTYDKYEYEQMKFYDYDGNEVSFDDLVTGETYYADTNHTNVAPHYLSTATDGTHVFEYLTSNNENGYEEGYYYLYDTTDDEDEEYSIYDIYMIDDEPAKVSAFDTQYAKSVGDGDSSEYEYCIAVGNTGGEWVTVNFFVHTGSEDKSYRLELWSGKRDETGVDANGDMISTGAVAFDYSAYNVEDSTFDTLLSEYTSGLIDEYNQLLKDNGLLNLVESYDENLAYYEELFDNLTTSDAANADAIKAEAQTIRDKYTALYYTFSLYDSADYVPFNADTAEDEETGYDYSASDYSETLAYFKYDTDDTYNIFIDYTAVDQSVDIGTITDEDDDEDDDETDWGQIALYISSIVLVVALLITLAALLIRELVKKLKRRHGVKQQSKNMYRKRERYIRRLHLERNEDVVEDTESTENADETETTTESKTETESTEEISEENSEGGNGEDKN